MVTLEKILEETKDSPLADALEKKAHRILKQSQKESWDSSPRSMIAREIALTLDHLDRLRAAQQDQEKNLGLLESYTNTELIQMEDRTPRYSPLLVATDPAPNGAPPPLAFSIQLRYLPS